VADELGATVVRLRGTVADELVAYAQAHNVATVVIGHPTHSRWEEFLHGSVTNDLLRKMPGVDVHVIAERVQARRKEPGGMAITRRRPRAAYPARPARTDHKGWPLAEHVTTPPCHPCVYRAR
jgi:two-component system, OmpR family, sensor histidine kinase KdpD